jgi:hypothetical protein
MAEGRVVIGGQPRGAAFFIGPDLAITARHVIKDALDSDGNPKQGLEFTLELQDGSPRVAVVEASDPILDVASVRIAEPSAEWFRTGVPTKDAAWEVTTRFLSADPVLTGTIVDPARPIRNNTDHETALIQLDVKQSLGSYEGYSGSPVCVQTTRPGSAPSPVAVGVLVEQGEAGHSRERALGRAAPCGTRRAWPQPRGEALWRLDPNLPRVRILLDNGS